MPKSKRGSKKLTLTFDLTRDEAETLHAILVDFDGDEESYENLNVQYRLENAVAVLLGKPVVYKDYQNFSDDSNNGE